MHFLLCCSLLETFSRGRLVLGDSTSGGCGDDIHSITVVRYPVKNRRALKTVREVQT